jgi:hypothetical protein
MSQRDRGMVELGRELLPQHSLPQVDRRTRRRGRQDVERRLVQLESARCLVRLDNHPFDLEHALRSQQAHLCHELGRVDDDLHDPASVPEEQECVPAQAALVMKPAGDTDALARVHG